ncbi:MAG: hypothetical protein NTW28_30740 [Candidatus Solibacter sp.]|nr:hypothetical protein [Candidatus Solibacter sp.]
MADNTPIQGEQIQLAQQRVGATQAKFPLPAALVQGWSRQGI